MARLRLTAFFCGCALLVCSAAAAASGAEAAGLEFFEKKIRPVLADRCFECHSHQAKKLKANLYLDSRQGLLDGGETGVAIVLGEPDKSRLIEAVRSTNPDLQMPPKQKLADSVIADLAEWIKIGAPWPKEDAPELAAAAKENSVPQKRKNDHWAWQPVRTRKPPPVANRNWAHNEIDQFIMARLEEKDLLPAQPAGRRTLIRRAYFDLIGLPPTPEEVEAFVQDTSPEAFTKMVDHLLASPHYGERFGRHWLDVARYGEDQAHSFQPRLYPQGFRYRDWLVRALNTDLPYDRFIKEQIAGDLIEGADRTERLAALGFFALGPVYYGDSKMFDQLDDRVDTLTRGFLGLTVACARCHDHKYDPIATKDYYALAGIFASTEYVETPLVSTNVVAAYDKAQSTLQTRKQEIDKLLEVETATLNTNLPAEISRYLVAAWKLHNQRKIDAQKSVTQAAQDEGLHSLILERYVKYLFVTPKGERDWLARWFETLEKQDARTDLSTNETAVAEIKKAADAFQTDIHTLIKLRTALDEHAAAALANSSEKKKELTPKLEPKKAMVLEEIVGKEGLLGLAKTQVEQLMPEKSKVRLAELRAEYERLKKEAPPKYPFVHTLKEGSKIRDLPILLRGNPEAAGEMAARGFLPVLASEPACTFTNGSGRLELACAIADKNNPLTSRVMVNRVWQHHFGKGLVRTPSNFGTLGELPTHPELLDFLAAWFVQHNWSLKSLHRFILNSATWQQRSESSVNSESVISNQYSVHQTLNSTPRVNGRLLKSGLLMTGSLDTDSLITDNWQRASALDPENKLLWRSDRQRLEVEVWRDAILAVAGNLDRTMGGPSVSLAAPDNQRRTFYAAVSRHDLDALLRLFDFPDPNVTSDTRTTTTVPLQQLFVLNSEFMVRQSKALAARLKTDLSESETARVHRAFLLVYGRSPQGQELNLALNFLNSIAANSESSSEFQNHSPEKLTKWEQYAQVLLSANEFMYVD